MQFCDRSLTLNPASLPAVTVIDYTDPTLARLNPLDIIRKLILNFHVDWYTNFKVFFSRADFKVTPDAYAVFRNAWCVSCLCVFMCVFVAVSFQHVLCVGAVSLWL